MKNTIKENYHNEWTTNNDVKISEKIRKFFFPFFSFNIQKSISFFLLISFLVALKITLSFYSIPIKQFNISISIANLPIIIIGWYFGPIIGLFIGILSDTLTFWINGGIWFWMYAMEEPIVCFIAGIFGSLCELRKNWYSRKYIIFDIIFNQLISFGFIIFCFSVMCIWINTNISQNNRSFIFYMTLICIFLSFICYEFLIIYNIFNAKNKYSNNKQLINLIYLSSCVLINIVLFSFILGPIAAIEFFKFIGGMLPSQYINFNFVSYLLPRIVIQAIKVPLEILLLKCIINIFDEKILMMMNNKNIMW